MELAWIGLSLIIIAWAVQVYSMLHGEKELNPLFAGFQFIGILVLVIGSITSELVIAALNFLTLIGAGIVLFLSLK